MSTIKRQHHEIADQKIVKKIKIDLEFKLPDEIWLKIIAYLKIHDLFLTFALVNKHFNTLSQDSTILKSLKLMEIRKKKDFRNVIKVIERSKNLKEFSVELCKPFWRKFMNLALENSKLKSLEILNHNDWSVLSTFTSIEPRVYSPAQYSQVL